MKKICLKFFSLMIALLVAVVLTGCSIKQGTKIEFAKLPAGVYTTESRSIDLSKVAIKINDGAEMSLKDAQASSQYNITITGDSWSTWGEYTLVVILDNAAITFNYEVVQQIVEVTYDTTWAGQGTEDDPWQIGSEEELKGLAAVVNGKAPKINDEAVADASLEGKYIKLMNNIKLTPGWEPIGAGNRGKFSNYFSGNFDGNNKVISGLTNVGYNPVEVAGTYTSSTLQEIKDGYVYGLFCIIKNATIQNVVMGNVYTEDVSLVVENEVVKFTSDSIAAIVGYSPKGTNNTIENCHVLDDEINGYDAVAGIIGRSYGGLTIKDCSNAAKVTCNKSGYGKSGGIIGIVSLSSATVSNCINSGNVTSKYTSLAGGIVGRVMNGCTFKENGNSNTGRIFAANSKGELTETSLFGMLHGKASSNGIENLENWGRTNEK
ncbi:MAG: hypothetical protein IJB21_08025 [Bacilli bacterium]|nr:hypothetical protein [Bacilli bacterium]